MLAVVFYFNLQLKNKYMSIISHNNSTEKVISVISLYMIVQIQKPHPTPSDQMLFESCYIPVKLGFKTPKDAKKELNDMKFEISQSCIIVQYYC